MLHHDFFLMLKDFLPEEIQYRLILPGTRTDHFGTIHTDATVIIDAFKYISNPETGLVGFESRVVGRFLRENPFNLDLQAAQHAEI